MCGSPKIPAQDPRFAEASMREVQLAERQYQDYMGPGGDREWMRNTANEVLGLSRTENARAGRLADYQYNNMQKNDQRYWDVAVPYEDATINRVNEMDSEAYRERQAGMAKADVAQEFDAGKAGLVRDLARYGMNDGSAGAAVAMARQQQGRQLAMASAANKTRIAADQMGLSNRMQLYGGMRGMAGLGATSAQLATGASALGLSAGQGMTGAVGSSLNANNNAFATYAGGVNGGVNSYNGYYANSLKGAEIQAANDPMKTILGAAAGAAGTYFTAGMMPKK